ncbi:MAG: prepilin-type N-terminal cleavage/methylation domain-containing protein [Burkholderiales bacterium]|jgi:prepilin-type N-terminal cleavage/methylation domain-containing protein|nr:prepilin-type N-terminal cleavage/methylation domain-containing protein [Burkholderiales bacterium]
MNSRKKWQGFTLLEVLVAFVVLAALGTVLFRALGTALNSIDTADSWGRAVEVAQNQLARASMEQPLKAGTTNGKDGDVQWQIVIEPYAPPPELGESLGVMNLETLHMMKIYRLVATVTFPGMSGNERAFSLSTTKVTMDSTR